MLAYAEGRRRIAERRSSPSTMLMIVGGHVAVLALAMSAKFIVEQHQKGTDTEIEWIKEVKPTPPPPPPPETQARPAQERIFRPTVIVPSNPVADNPIDTTPIEQPGNDGPVIGNDPPTPRTLPLQVPDPVRVGPRLATSPDALRPPYPRSKLDSQEEAALRLRLSIDERGRVVAVDPVGAADAAFLAAARKHLIAKWRYQPATVDGRPIATSTVITLRFELEG